MEDCSIYQMCECENQTFGELLLWPAVWMLSLIVQWKFSLLATAHYSETVLFVFRTHYHNSVIIEPTDSVWYRTSSFNVGPSDAVGRHSLHYVGCFSYRTGQRPAKRRGAVARGGIGNVFVELFFPSFSSSARTRSRLLPLFLAAILSTKWPWQHKYSIRIRKTFTDCPPDHLLTWLYMLSVNLSLSIILSR